MEPRQYPQLPDIDESIIASSINEHSPCVKATVYCLDGQYAIRYREGDKTTVKFISTSAVRTAFAAIPVDSNYLLSGTVRWGQSGMGTWIAIHQAKSLRNPIVQNNNRLVRLCVPLPAFVFFGCGQRYWIAATRDRHFSPTDRAYHMPLPNVYPNGQICFGESRPPICEASTIRQAIDLFFESIFTSHSVEGKSISHPDDIRVALAALNGKKTYRVRDLVPMTASCLNEWICNRIAELEL